MSSTNKQKSPERRLLDGEKRVAQSLNARKLAVFERFQIVFTLLGAFGLVATFYGFERLIDQVQFFSDNPIALLLTGISTLIFTGGLYKMLQ